jgi:hypothetical protein
MMLTRANQANRSFNIIGYIITKIEKKFYSRKIRIRSFSNSSILKVNVPKIIELFYL